MSNYNRTEHLKQLHSKRKAMTQERVDKAIQRLIKAQKAINFNSVASESGVTKKTLYDNKDIRERIETLRYQQSQVPTPSQVKREMNDNNKDAIIASLKRKLKDLKKKTKNSKNNLRLIMLKYISSIIISKI